MQYNIAKRIYCMSLKFCIVMYMYYGPVAFNCKIKYLYCIVLIKKALKLTKVVKIPKAPWYCNVFILTKLSAFKAVKLHGF